MNEQDKISFLVAHYESWLSSTKFSSLQAALSSPRKFTRGQDVVESNQFFYKTGCSRKVLEALVKCDLKTLQDETDKFKIAFGEGALNDGTYVLEMDDMVIR